MGGKGSGGRRKGAGRPGGDLVKITIKIPKWMKERLEHPSSEIRDALIEQWTK